MVTETLIATMVNRIVEQFHPVQVVLFGSQARRTATGASDVDLLVVLPEMPDKRRAAVEIRRALGDLPISKDIVVATPEEITRRGHLVGSVLRSALREGKVVYERNWPEATQADAERASSQARAVYESVTAEFTRHGAHTGETEKES
jgi:predicted nucleotidyltransferase